MQNFCTIKTKFRQAFSSSQTSETQKHKVFQQIKKKMKLSLAFVSAAVANNIQAGTGFAPGTFYKRFNIISKHSGHSE